MKKLPISCFIVYHNESELIRASVESVLFCEDVTVLDISGSDNLTGILTGLPVKIIPKQKELIVELIRIENIKSSKYNWILLLDPDERIDEKLFHYLQYNFNNFPLDTAGLEVSWRFYFKRKQLKGTFWGNSETKKLILFNKTKVAYSTTLHVNHAKFDNESKFIQIDKKYGCVHHYWSNSYRELISKHKRYLRFEGEHKYKSGARYNLKVQVKGLMTDFIDSFLIYKGWKDGLHGFLLSSFYAYYRFNIWISVRRYQKSLKS